MVDFSPLAPEDIRRAAQLTLRTNQFNFTTIRREEADLQALLSGGRHEIRTVRVRDRFGDYGLVGLLIAERGDREWTLDTFLLSCRVLGRGAEHRIMAQLGEMAVAAGAESVRLRVETTKRNRPARNFVESIIPADLARADERAFECEIPAPLLAAVKFEPATTGEVVVQEERSAASAQAIDVTHLRQREEQIRRAAFELSSGAALRAAAEGRSAGAPGDVARPSSPIAGQSRDSHEIATTVQKAFADALRVPVEQVAQLDHLEALGCDSLKIVEITVALTEKFPWLPGTLLFEHRSVSEIVREIAALAGQTGSASGVTAAAGSEARARAIAPSRHGDIAVVGIHLRCAGANSPQELWDLLSRRGSGVVPVPIDRPHFLQPLSDDRSHWAGLLDDPARFDAELFGVSPREAEYMDPQLRLFLEVAWSALEDAGCLGDAHEPNTGVFAGVMYADYGFRANLSPVANGNAYRCWEGFSLANRLSHLLGFAGPSLAIDTACSSSATAVHVACASLNAGDCRVAVVGGVNLILDSDRLASLGRLGILSERGRCEPFGADADGTVLGEGAGVVVLRSLEDALGRGDRIYGVIKGTGVSTGNGTVGFTAPNPQAQAEAVRRGLRRAAVDPRTVSYIETHGTGTHLGDPIEIRGLTLGYGDPELRDPSLALEQHTRIGSIKPNIGHLEAGAGVMGLIKVLLQLHHGMLLPSITSNEPNPQIAFARGVFDVQTTLEPWTRRTVEVNGGSMAIPRRAAINSFGVGGANAHVVVEEAPEQTRAALPLERPAHLLALSARSESALQRQVVALKQFLATSEAPLQDVCFSVNTGRKQFPHRLALAGTTREELLRALDEPLAAHRDAGRAGDSGAPPKVAFLFTGQGSQYAGMGRQLYETQPVFRDALDRCAAVFDRLLDRPLLELLFADEGTAEAELLNQTGYTQPALFAFQYALSELWASWGVRPDVVMGHSVGEIAALCVAGGVSLEDGLKQIAARGRLMQALPAGGTMTSVMADEARVMAAIAGAEELVAIAAINAPGQVVISGDGVAVAEVAARLTADGIKTKNLTVSHAFHSPLMKPMLAEYERVVRNIRFSPPRIPFVSCVEGELVRDEVTRADYWLRQVMNPVRFAAGMQTLQREQATVYIEIGPNPVLLGMGRQCLPDADAAWLPSMRRDTDSWKTLLGSVAAAYARGALVDWRGFDAPYQRTRLLVPGYDFSRKQYWLKRLPRFADEARVAERGDQSNDETLRASGVYEVVWRKEPMTAAPAQSRQRWVVIADDEADARSLAGEFETQGGSVTVLTASRAEEALSKPATLETLGFGRNGVAPRIVFMSRGPLDQQIPTASHLPVALLTTLTHIVRTLVSRGVTTPALWLVTRGAVSVGGHSDPVSPLQSLLWGFARTLSLEQPQIWGAAIDEGRDVPVTALARELSRADGDDQVALFRDERYVARLARRSVSDARPIALSSPGTYLVTGGVGALGLHAARWLVDRGARQLVLTSRRGATEAARATLQTLTDRGAQIDVVSADLSTAADVERVLRGIADGHAPLRGIVHAAGVDSVVPLVELTARQIEDAVAAKVCGAALLHERTRGLDLDLFLCFSSVAAVLGSQGRAHYSAANAFLDGLVDERRRLGLRGTSINWGPWRGGGMATAASLEQFERVGNRGLDPAAAIDVLDTLVANDVPRAAVMSVDWSTFAPIYETRRKRPLINEIVGETGAPPQRSANATAAPWIARLGGVPSAERPAALVTLLRAEVADTLGFDDASSVPVDRNFYEMGMDSLMMADLVGRLKSRTGVSCSALAFNHPQVSALAGAMIGTLPLDDATPEAASGAVDAADTGALPVDEILAFQFEAFPARRKDWVVPRWRWMFVQSAERLGVAPKFWIHREAGRIVGQMGSIPVRLQIGAEQRDARWLVDTMVLEQYRSQAVGPRLMVVAHEDEPFSLSLGQTAEMREIQFRLGWKQVAAQQVAQLLVRPDAVLKGKLPRPAAWAAGLGVRATSAVREWLSEPAVFETRTIDRFDTRHDELWRSVAQQFPCAIVRDASYLNWKYVEQPGQRFVRVDVMERDGLRGTAVWMIRDADRHYNYRRAFLVDLVTSMSDATALRQTVKAACKVAMDLGVDSLLCHHISARLTRALRACGFRLRQPQRFLLIDPGPLEGPTLERVLSAESWYVTHGDSDIDRPW